MAFKDVLGHSRPITLLQRAIRNGKVVNSYLFLGNEGIGKKVVALQFAGTQLPRRLREERHVITALPKKIGHALHPDVLLIEPEGKRSRSIRSDNCRRNWLTDPMKEASCLYPDAADRRPLIPNTS
jgi:DNA polymerase III delta prime subunit